MNRSKENFNTATILNTFKLSRAYVKLFLKKADTLVELFSSKQGFIINELSFYEQELIRSQLNIKHYKNAIQEIENNFPNFDDIDQGLKHNELEIYQYHINDLEEYCTSLQKIIVKRTKINELERSLVCLKINR